VVGDDDQSIYGWRGAEVTHILRFRDDWPEAKVVWLEVNYRSTREIIAWSNRLIGFNKQRHPKVLRATSRGEPPRILQFESEELEAKGVVEEVQTRLQEQGVRPRDVAILFRTNEQPRLFEAELRRTKIPYVLVGGMSFYDRKEVRDLLAYLKLLVNPHDEVSLLRVINTPPRGIGQATITRLLEQAVAAGRPVWDVLGEASQAGRLPAAAASGIARFRSLLGGHRGQLAHRGLAEVVRSLIVESGYREELARLYPEQAERESRLSAVEEVVNAAAGYCRREASPTLSGFLQEVALTGSDDDRDRETKLARDAVALMTLHAAKGLEFREVYLVGMEEGLLPHRRSVDALEASAIDEERRLCYVGLTRAQKRLSLTLALSRMKWGKARPTIPSRFLYEITGQADNPNYLAAIQQRPPKSPSSSGRPGRGKG
jgi:DNA helicase-2/ATP-dependent DNA helicase PcrA